MNMNHSSTSEGHFPPYSEENNNGQTSSNEPPIRVDTTEARGCAHTSLLPGESLVSNKLAGTSQALSYLALKEYHLKRVRFDDKGNERPHRYLANHNSVLNSWEKYLSEQRGVPFAGGSGDLLLIGDELGVNFSQSLAKYLEKLEKAKYSQNTINDRKSIMWSVRESFIELNKSSALPESFNEALRILIRNSGKTMSQIAEEHTVPNSTLFKWSTGLQFPNRASLPAIERLEDAFGVARGTLTNRLTHLTLVHRDGPFESCTTPWRQHLSKVLKYRFRLTSFTPKLEIEVNDLTRFFTDDVWLEINGFERKSEWRIDPDGNIPSADRYRGDLLGFMGWLTLPPNVETPWLNGKGMSPESLSLALMSDAGLVLSFIDFRRSRSYSESYNTGTVIFLSFCASLLRKETGFLRQQPQYGAKLPDPVAPEDWDSWCKSNRKKILKFLKKKKAAKNRPVVMTRDPFAAVRQFIEDLEQPITILIEMVNNMKGIIPLLKKGNPVVLAQHVRDTFFAEFITSYPLRIKNFSRMKVFPRAQSSEDAKLKLADPKDMNLYQKPDGSWWIRYTKLEMKNGEAVNVPVADSVVPMLEEYLFVHRPVLLKAIKDAINLRRAKFGMSPLTAGEQRAIELSLYVFRPGHDYIHRMNDKQLTEYTGTERLSESTMSDRMRHMSQRYIPNCKGFSAHAVRHLVASDYIKNYPDGFSAAAAALNDTVATVRKHYAWIRPCDKIKPWQDYHEKLKRRFSSSDESNHIRAAAA
jgi:integrase